MLRSIYVQCYTLHRCIFHTDKRNTHKPITALRQYYAVINSRRIHFI